MRALQAFAWSAICLLLAALCIAVWLLPVDQQIELLWQSTRWQAQPWTLWTASLVHMSDSHMAFNMVALLCLAIISQHVGANHWDAIALLLAWPALTLALWLWPQIQFYAGFSGVNHAIAGVLIARSAMVFIVRRQISAIAFLLACMLLAKLIWEAPWAQPLRTDASWGFTVVQAAHLAGFISGLLAFAAVQAARIFFTKAVVE